MERATDKKDLLQYINILVNSFSVSLLDIFNKFFYDYNNEIERAEEFTVIGIKGHLISCQEESMVISTMWFEYGILKEPYSERKEVHEVQWQSILDKEINYKGSIKQLEDNFDVIKKEVSKFYLFTPQKPLDLISQFADIKVDVKVGSKSFSRSSKDLT